MFKQCSTSYRWLMNAFEWNWCRSTSTSRWGRRWRSTPVCGLRDNWIPSTTSPITRAPLRTTSSESPSPAPASSVSNVIAFLAINALVVVFFFFFLRSKFRFLLRNYSVFRWNNPFVSKFWLFTFNYSVLRWKQAILSQFWFFTSKLFSFKVKKVNFCRNFLLFTSKLFSFKVKTGNFVTILVF